MAEWKYRIEHIELGSTPDSDFQLEKILREQGEQGWELVQILHDGPNNPDCRLIFKTEKQVPMN